MENAYFASSYFAKAWLLSQIIFNTDDASRFISDLVNNGKVSLGYAVSLPCILTEELQQLGEILGRDWRADVESFKNLNIENFVKIIA